jgi:hypothetical protein
MSANHAHQLIAANHVPPSIAAMMALTHVMMAAVGTKVVIAAEMSTINMFPRYCDFSPLGNIQVK